MNCLWDFCGLRVRHVVVISAMVLGVGLPLTWAQFALFGPSNRLLFLATAHARLSADALTAVLMTAYCLLFGAALFAGHCFLRRFLDCESSWVYCGHDNPDTPNGENPA